MIIEDIKKHLYTEYPKEGCGIIYGDGENIHWAPIKNVSNDLEEFLLDKKEYLWYYERYKILSVVHSHPNLPATPSTFDINNCNASQLNYYIFSLPSEEEYILEPVKHNTKELLARPYYFGLYDCFETMRDYYRSINLTLKPRELYENNWWNKGYDYFSEENLLTHGFTKTDKLEKDCLITFRLDIKVKQATHCGVYVGEEQFIHHQYNKLSAIEPLTGAWKRIMVGIYKHEKTNS